MNKYEIETPNRHAAYVVKADQVVYETGSLIFLTGGEPVHIVKKWTAMSKITPEKKPERY